MAGNDGSPLEPEVEQVTVDDERRRMTANRAQELEDLPLDFRRCGAKMGVRDEVAWRGEHEQILVVLRALYKLRRSTHPSRTTCSPMEA
jgi:hypothetical protein